MKQTPELTVENVIELYKEIGANERHFNELESRYRFQAGAWSLSAFAAMGFVALSQAADSLDVDRNVICGLIGTLGAIGITLVWNLDVRVYHQLLDCQFVEGVELESRYRWLPASRRKLFAKYTGNNKEHTKVRILLHLQYFYAGMVGLVLSVTGLFFGRALYTVGRESPTLWIAAPLIGIVAVMWVRFIFRNSRSVPIGEWVERQQKSDDH